MSPQAKTAPENTESGFQVPEGWATVLFDNAYALREQYEKLIAARRANREALRNLSAQGLLNSAELEELEELYPVREQKKDENKKEPAAA